MEYILPPVEVRVLGCLVEKESTTPDGYPLTLNSLTSACNQKTNRDPVMSLTDNTVMEAAESLIRKTLVSSRSGSGSRVAKYSHRLTGRLREEMNFSQPELAVLATLMLRGPQTLGEIRTRCTRIHEFTEIAELSGVLETLGNRADGPFVAKLARLPGRKEPRYAHLFGGDIDEDAVADPDEPMVEVDDTMARVQSLEIGVGELKNELAELRHALEGIVTQLED